MNDKRPPIALCLTGGGARGSYQAGVIAALSEILQEQGLSGATQPFQHLYGVSAGAINAAYCAAGANDLKASTKRLAKIWSDITPNQVYRTDLATLGGNSLKWVKDLTFGPLFKERSARSLLDTEPLYKLVDRGLLYRQITKNIKSKVLLSLGCSAYNYREAKTYSFIQTELPVSWDKHRRVSKLVDITAQHIMASCAIPIIFPSIEIEGTDYADGGFRDTAPLAPAIHLGAKKLLVVGVQGPNEREARIQDENPGIARIAGTILNALFFDTLAIDIERIQHLNEIISANQSDIKTTRSEYAPLDIKVIQPSYDISVIAEQKVKYLPPAIKYLLAGIGNASESATLSSYILFANEFTRDLIALGRQDLLRQKEEIVHWLRAGV